MNNIVVITSALAPNIGIFSPIDRFSQTKLSIESVRDRIPNSKIYLTDVSVNNANKYKDNIKSLVDVFIDATSDDSIVTHSKYGLKSKAELLLYKKTLLHIKNNEDLNKFDRIFKLSGRYVITKDFDLAKYDSTTYNKYVFRKAITSWIDPDKYKLYTTRLWSMHVNNVENYLNKFLSFFNMCEHPFDIEHAYHAHLDQKDVLEFDMVGVEGRVAPNGKYEKD